MTSSPTKAEFGKSKEKSVSNTPTEAESGETLKTWRYSPADTRFGKAPQNTDSYDSSKDSKISEIQQDLARTFSNKTECGATPKLAQSDSLVKY